MNTATESGTSGSGSASNPSAGPGGTVDTTDTVGTVDTVDTGDTGTDTATGVDTTEGSTDTEGPAGVQVTVLPSSVAVLEEDEEGELTVDCLLTEDGVPIPDPGAFMVTVSPGAGVNEAGGVYTFPNTALFDVTCSIDYDGQLIESTTTVSVLNESIDPGLAELGAGIGQAMRGLTGVIASNNLEDQVLFDAIDQLDASLPMLQSTRVANMEDVLRPLPFGYPTGPELEAAGIMANADDAAFEGALDQLDAVLLSFETTMAGIDPMSTDKAILDALEGDLAEFEAAVDGLQALSPSAHGLMAQRGRVATLMGERVQPAVHQSVQYLSDRIHIEAGVPNGEDGPHFHFGILSFSIGMFGQNNLRVQLINKWYGDYIAQLDESINNFALSGLIDEAFPPGGEGPVIEVLQASASLGFATPGYPSWIDGYNFDDEINGFNLMLVFGDSWQGIIDNIITACGIEHSDHPAEAVEKFVTCVEDIEAAVDSIFWYPVSVGPGLFGSSQGLDMGPFPEVCSGGLPTATFVLPMTWKGRGPSYFINCI